MIHLEALADQIDKVVKELDSLRVMLAHLALGARAEHAHQQHQTKEQE